MTRTYLWTKSRDDDAAARPGARPEKNLDSDKMHTWSRKVVHGRPTPVHVRQGILHVPGEGQHELLGQLQQPFLYAIGKGKQTELWY